MTVFRDFELAKSEMIPLSRKLHKDIYMTFTSYGNNPTRLEYCLRIKEEMVNPYSFTTCIAIYHTCDGMLDILTKDDLYRYFPNLKEPIKSTHHCGDMPMSGSSSSLDEIPFKNNSYE